MNGIQPAVSLNAFWTLAYTVYTYLTPYTSLSLKFFDLPESYLIEFDLAVKEIVN